MEEHSDESHEEDGIKEKNLKNDSWVNREVNSNFTPNIFFELMKKGGKQEGFK
jgi:hypothetical protein